MVRPYPPADMELIGAGVDHREPAAIPAAAFGWTRFSESAVPERYDAAFYAPAAGGTRNSLVTFDAPPKLGFDGFGGTGIGAGGKANGGVRDSSTSVASGFEPLQYWPLDDFDAGELSHGSLSMTQPSATLAAEPFLGVSVDVNNHSINNQGVVMYHVDVRSPDGVLATYTIRRRYRAFKNLYAELSKLMDEFAASSTRAAADAAFSSKVVAGVTPREPFVPLSPHSLAAERRLGGGGAMAGPPLSIGGRALELPSLPSAGVWSYLKRHDVHLVEQRKRRFQEILRLAIRHPATRHSAKLEAFLGVAPSEISQRGSSYVSLMDYSVPVVDRQRESIERRQRKLRVLEDRRLRTASTEAA